MQSNHQERTSWPIKAATVFSLFAFSLAVRFITAEYVENGGDCVTLWFNIRRAIEGVGFNAWNHHTMRWAITTPLLVTVKAFGTAPWVYYVLPFIYSSCASALAFLVGEKIQNYRTGVLAAVLLTLYPQMTQAGSQIWPGVFELAYILASVFLILLWLDSGAKKWLFCAAFLFFCAWGSRVSSVFFFPGLLCLIWLPTRDWRAAFMFCVFVGALLLAELLVFHYLTGNMLGRVGQIVVTHGAQDELAVSVGNYIFNFLNYKKLRGLLIVLIILVGAAAVSLKSTDDKKRALAILFLSQLVLYTWLPSSVSPLKLALPIGTRYVTAVVPYGLLLLLCVLDEKRRTRSALVMTLVSLFVVAFVGFSAKKIPGSNSVAQTIRDQVVISQAFRGREPILMRYLPWEPNAIEAWVIGRFGGSKRKKVISGKELANVMRKNHNRIVSLFMMDMPEALRVYGQMPVQAGKESYWFGWPDQPAGDESVLVEFGRKSFRASPVTP